MPLRSTRILFIVLFFTQAAAVLAEDRVFTRFTVEKGSAVNRSQGLTLLPNEQGQILLGLADADDSIALVANQRASFSFIGQAPERIYLIWRRNDSAQLFQHGFPTLGNPRPHIDLAGVRDWRGHSHSLQVGFLVSPGTQLTLQAVRLAEPGISDQLHDLWRDWSAFRTWIPVDINLYTGTRVLHQGPHPMPAFALCALLLLLLYGLIYRRRARWSGAALIIFLTWLSLDALWQWRLWQQVDATRARYAGLDSKAKVLLSEDAAIARLADGAHRQISRPGTRVFVASQSDGNGMRAAYYLSPLNTYWHRRGPELPPRRYFRPGDQILAIAPSALAYDRDAGLLRLPDGGELPVIERQAQQIGLLLEVAP